MTVIVAIPIREYLLECFYVQPRNVLGRAVCEKSSVLLCEGENTKPFKDVVLDYDVKCPNCGKKLSFVSITIEIRVILIHDKTRQCDLIEKTANGRRDISTLITKFL